MSRCRFPFLRHGLCPQCQSRSLCPPWSLDFTLVAKFFSKRKKRSRFEIGLGTDKPLSAMHSCQMFVSILYGAHIRDFFFVLPEAFQKYNPQVDFGHFRPYHTQRRKPVPRQVIHKFDTSLPLPTTVPSSVLS